MATVGRIQAFPGGTNIIPGRCEFSIDTRHAEAGPRQQLLAEIEAIIQRVAQERELQAEVAVLMDHDPVPMSDAIRAEIEASIQALGLRYLVMPSGAGHDSEIIAPRFPTAMLFVPSKDGKSHTPEEYTPVEWVVRGCRHWRARCTDSPTDVGSGSSRLLKKVYPSSYFVPVVV